MTGFAARLSAAATLVAAGAVWAGTGGDRLVAAGSEDHAWWIGKDEAAGERPATTTGPGAVNTFVLFHAAWSDSPSTAGGSDPMRPVRRVAARFAAAPEALAAAGDSVWVLFPPETVTGRAGEVARREILTLSTRRNPAVGHWYSVPANGADPRPSLEVPIAAAGGAAMAGELVGFALHGPADRPEPWVLLGGGPADRLGVRLVAGEAGGFGLRAFRLAGFEWREVPLPAGISGDGARLVRMASGQVALLARLDGPGGATFVRHERSGDGWLGPEPFVGDLPSLAAWLVVDGRDAVASFEGDDLALSYLRGSPDRPLTRSLAWTSLPVPADRWAILGGRDAAHLVTASGETARRTRIPALGTFADAQTAEFVPPGFGSGAWIHLPLLTALVLFILLGLLFLRELRGPAETPSVAATRPFELPRRLAALAIDATPGAIAAMAFLDASPLDLVRVPFSSLDVAAAIPATVTAGSTCLIGFLGEAFLGRSPGKWLLGGEVVRRDGGRAGILRHFGRNLLKFLALVAPPLVIPTLLSTDGSGVPERLTGTAVARRA